MRNMMVSALTLLLSFSNLIAQPAALYKEILNVSYLDKTKEDSLRMLNLVIPESDHPPPLFIWIGGGAWSYVDRAVEMDFARKLAEKGIAVASVGHRLSPATWKDPALNTGVQHPAHIRDVSQAVKWLVEQAGKYGYSKEHIFIGGYSSGAHLAALLCMNSQYLSEVGLSSEVLKGVVPIAGAYDIVNYYQVFLNSDSEASNAMADTHVKAVFGKTEAELREASPITYIDKLSTPMLLISDNDLYNYTALFEDALRNTDFTDWSVLHVREFGHSALWKDLSFSEESPYRDFIIGFIRSHSTEQQRGVKPS